MPTVLCAGLIAVDVVYTVDEYPAEDTKARATGADIVPGGGALKAASAVASLGGVAWLAGAIGEDQFGTLARGMIAGQGVDGALVADCAGLTTPHSAILISPSGARTIVNHREAALFDTVPDLPDPDSFDAVLTDTRWPAGAVPLLRHARAHGKPAVVDGEAPLSPEILAEASHIVFSEQGLADYAGGDALAALRAAAREFDAWTAVTRGGDPVLFHDGTEVASFPTIALDTLGAGDTWHGAFTLALADGRSEAEAARYANAASSVFVSRTGPDRYPKAVEVAGVMGEHPVLRDG